MKRSHKHWGALPPCAVSHRIASAVRQKVHKQVICLESDPYQAAARSRELSLLLPEGTPVLRLPERECLPYDSISPSFETVSSRIAVLRSLATMTTGVVVLSAESLIQRMGPRSYLTLYAFKAKVGDTLDMMAFCQALQKCGYAPASQVLNHAEFAKRGSIVDFYPMGFEQPVRLEFFDDEISQIRYFDPHTQRSKTRLKAIDILPAHEFPTDAEAVSRFRVAFAERFGSIRKEDTVYWELSKGLVTPGTESYLPLFFESTESVLDYLPADAAFILHPELTQALHRGYQEACDRFERVRQHDYRQLLQPDEILFEPDECMKRLQGVQKVEWQIADRDPGNAEAHITPLEPHCYRDASVLTTQQAGYEGLIDFHRNDSGRHIVTAENQGRLDTLAAHLHELGIAIKVCACYAEVLLLPPKVLGLVISEIDRGFIHPELSVIPDMVLLRRHYKARSRRALEVDPSTLLQSISQLQLGDPIVHREHGVGRYQGLKRLEDGAEELVSIAYKGGDWVYVPVLALGMLTRYAGGNSDTAPWHRLSDPKWGKAMRKSKQQLKEVAAALLHTAALRKKRGGRCLTISDEDMAQIAIGFRYQLTQDQEKAIVEVREDLAKPVPMDRLICADVGFGKTEIALRAAWCAVHSGTQVAVLCPTTLLANQQYQLFCDRFASLPVHCGLLSRATQGQQAMLQHIREGKIDIVIGTHRLLQPDVQFKDLGLAILDEEHRFGTRQKERFKHMRAQVDTLTLTATPIPRTLNMALSGLRDISFIQEPPLGRMHVQTYLHDYDPVIVQDACHRELHRGGQVFFVHSDIKTIARVEADVRALLPDVEIRVAHGSMPSRQLAAIMDDFYHARFRVLLSTTIVESGLDVSNANTIIINHADRFGLSQLHQLRGRVGRSSKQAYAYLLVHRSKLNAGAHQRLQSLLEHQELGSGFMLANADLEIRGAGELLGEQQSGLVSELGLALYTEYLEQAVRSLSQDEPDGALAIDPAVFDLKIDLGVAALLPEHYIYDVHCRLSFYKRLAQMQHPSELARVRSELIDRFGALPLEAESLLAIHRIKQQAMPLRLKSIQGSEACVKLFFGSNNTLDVARLAHLCQHDSQMNLRPDCVELREVPLQVRERLDFVSKRLEQIAPLSSVRMVA